MMATSSRYPTNAESRLRFPTVEPIIGQASWSLSLPRMTGTTLVGVPGVDELSLQRQVKQAGGKWNPVECVWEMRYSRATALGL
jgi:hypothetical protein